MTLGHPLVVLGAGRALAVEDAELEPEVVDLPPAVLDGRRDGVLADRHPGAGGVQQADGLVRELSGRDVAVRELHGALDGLVEDAHAVVLLQDRGDPAHHPDGAVLVGLLDLDDLEPPRQRRVLLEVLLVLGPGGGGDGAQLAAGQGRLEQVGGVVLAGLAAGADHGVGLVDEEDDRDRASP